MIRKVCPLCGGNKYKLLYPKTFDADRDLNLSVFSARRLPDRLHGTIIKCQKCGLVRTLEVISPSKLKKLYMASLFTYGNLTQNLKITYGQILADASSKLSQKTAFLEIGCGNGFMLEEAAKLGYQKIKGLEPSADALKKARPAIKKLITPGLLRPKLFPPSSFDIIVAFQVFDHVADPNNFLKTCRTYLKSKGILLLMNHDVNALSARILGEKSPIFDIEHTYLYSQATITQILKKNRFTIEKIYDPPSLFQLRYLARLLPLKNSLKTVINNSKHSLFNINISLHAGNLAVYARK